MAEVTQYTFTWPELAEILIKQQGIHEGEWLAVVEFAVAAGVIGQGPPEAKPGVLVTANGVQLQKAVAGAPQHLVVDAAKVNPKT
jgi:hypothetical protein